ncbi:MAG TPA: ATP-dependent RNA helicase HrpA [Chthoniobacteraceae bacterium]|nr:ATP-dependent RNA helicase HrpA [Chthoniobacteraceae bacterium]
MSLSIEYPPDLPITARRVEIVAALRTSQVLIVAGETGSGKTTQLPKMCLEAGLALRGKIGCTQPRRVAAMSISRRVAEELKVAWGREVGCKMRFNDDTSRETQIKFMTDGILLAEIQSDPMLRAYSALIIDEAHERSLNIDFLLGYLQGLLKRRGDLKLIVTSATIDTVAFSKAFGGAPIIEVSGRMFPVAVRYAPVESFSITTDPEEIGFIEAAARAAEDALIETDSGDVLIFLPTERDIRDCRDLLEGSLGTGMEVLGLFGRMPAAEQARIFAPGDRRRVIVATNIAETSLTLPRIRTVIDAGLSRMSRYNPRTRTKRLPVEAISQSSANQRTGRAGRVREGVCIRLYDLEDFEKRPRFTQPEIQRANLAEVILRMKAFRLGDVETFPFLDPPHSAAIRAGYALLHELGALDETNELTPLGRELARLPLDPTLGRMLLEARKEGALPEMLVIAAGLSVPDPRERPEEQKEAAAAAHRAFADPDSDFLTLLKIWDAAPDPATKGSHNALRRFCKANFLSLTRMREWRDVWSQLRDAMREERPGRTGEAPKLNPSTESRLVALHRSILTGLLGQIGQREDRNVYKASGNRLLTVFPGSNLYERREKVRKSAPQTDSAKPVEKTRQPLWIMAAEVVETSQLFARTIARIDPEWVVELGAHLCEFRYSEPHWNVKAERVLAWERVLVHGLEIVKRRVDYGRIAPAEATEIFIRGALVAGEARIAQRFFAQNQKLREKVETALTRVRSGRVHDLDEAFYRFYAARLESGISSPHDLNRIIRARISAEPDFLCATEADLISADELDYDRQAFPDQVSVGNSVLPVSYAYTPGEEHDGVTVRVPLPLAEQLTSGQLQWIVPGLREEQIAVLLRALPKTLRRPLMPLEPKIAEIVREFQPGRGEFLASLAEFVSRKYRVSVQAADWPRESLPAHLQPRVEVIDRKNQTVVAGRDLALIRSKVEGAGERTDAWEIAARRWEKRGLKGWTFGDLPESVVIEEIGGAPLFGYPGLALREGEVDVRLFRKESEAEAAAVPAIRRLAELTATADIAWLWREVRSIGGLAGPVGTHGKKPPANLGAALSAFGQKLQPTPKAGVASPITTETLSTSAYEHLATHIFRLTPLFPLTELRFRAMLEAAHRDLPLLVRRVADLTSQILTLRQQLLASTKRYPQLESDVQRLVPPDFLAQIPHAQLAHLPRYLRAMVIRAERAVVNPAKDAEKVKQLAPFGDWRKQVPAEQAETFRWLLEEFRVSLFAQELGTSQPVSTQRLKALGGWR